MDKFKVKVRTNADSFVVEPSKAAQAGGRGRGFAASVTHMRRPLHLSVCHKTLCGHHFGHGHATVNC